MSAIRPIRTEADYNWALAEIEQYFDKEPALGSRESDRFEILSTLIEAYEEQHWPVDPADPVDAIVYAMNIAGRSQADLAELLGSRSRASEVLRRKRPLTMAMAHKLHSKWKVPAEALIGPPVRGGRPARANSATRRHAAGFRSVARRASRRLK
jgi:HTH-type transcriptional regulator/antitoxin HigA